VVVISGLSEDPATLQLAARARREFLPEDAIVVTSDAERVPAGLDPSWLAGRAVAEKRARAFVCRGETCSLPTSDADALAALAGRAAIERLDG
jgi:uncharacterized protein YyaL (SSP411 family)